LQQKSCRHAGISGWSEFEGRDSRPESTAGLFTTGFYSERNFFMGHRRVARECALQMMYELDVGRHSKEEILRTYWRMNDHPERVRDFADELFKGTVNRLDEIDSVIQQHAKNWRLGRMAAVDRNVLRLAVFEFFTEGRTTPETVIINEALEIAKKFSTPESAQFVNGILDSIKNQLTEKRQVSDGKPD
jgi:transcription antitermination protein NusB